MKTNQIYKFLYKIIKIQKNINKFNKFNILNPITGYISNNNNFIDNFYKPI